MRWLLLIIPAAAWCATPNDTRELVRQSIQNGQKAWQVSTEYACTKRVLSRQFAGLGEIKSSSDDLYSIVPLGNGASFSEHIKHDGEPVSAEVRQKTKRELQKLLAELPSAKRHRFEKELAERSYMIEVPDAFNFRITGTQNLPTGPAWVLEAMPRPGFEPKSRYAHIFPKMHGTLWIDQKDVQWVKADAVATENISFGLFIARLAKGSHILLEQTRLPDGEWVPQSLEAKAAARTFLFFAHNFEEQYTYSEYHKPNPLQAAAR